MMAASFEFALFGASEVKQPEMAQSHWLDRRNWPLFFEKPILKSLVFETLGFQSLVFKA